MTQYKYIDKKLFANHNKDLQQYYKLRNHLIEKSLSITSLSKKAIFSLHKSDMPQVQKQLDQVTSLIKEVKKMFKKSDWLISEGSLAAGLEEYVEAVLFREFLQQKVVGVVVSDIEIDARIYIAGLCDVIGEVYRYSIKMASQKNIQEIDRCLEFSAEVIEQLLDYNLTTYLRTKFDQAKQAHRKMEMISYELRLRM